MKPDEMTWTAEQQVTVINPTSDPYRWNVHGKTYEIGAGKTAKMPGFIAWVYVYNMASKLCQEAGEWTHWNDEDVRPEWFAKVVIGVDELVQTIEEVAEPEVTTFGDADPEPGTGANYTPKAKTTSGGRPKAV